MTVDRVTASTGGRAPHVPIGVQGHCPHEPEDKGASRTLQKEGRFERCGGRQTQASWDLGLHGGLCRAGH